MGTIAVVLKLIILVFFLISTISFFFQKKEAASNTSKMIDELNNDENDQDIEFASQEVIEALQDIYKLSLTEPVRIAYVYGDVELKTLTVNGGTSIIFLIAGGRVEIPASLNADLIKGETHFEALLEDAEDAQVALVDDKLYLVSFGQYALINEQRSNELEQQSPMAAKEIQRGKIGGLPLEVVRERDATDNECLYFDPIKAGKRFAILMILIFVLAPIFIDDDSSVYAWAGIHGGAILVLLPLWYKFSRRQRKSFKVTLMRGEIHQVVSQDYEQFIRVFDENKEGKLDFLIPDSWAEKLAKYVNKPIQLEVLNGTNKVVSVDRAYSIETEVRTNPPVKNKYLQWMAITFVVLAINTFFHTDMHREKMALEMLSNPTVKQVNTLDEWTSLSKVGQRIQANQIYRICELGSVDKHDNATWNEYCNSFNVLNAPSDINLMAIANPIIKKFQILDSKLNFEEINAMQYMMLVYQNANNNAKTGANNTLLDKRDIVMYTQESLSAWAHWMENNNITENSIRTELMRLWKDVSKKTCAGDCWAELIAYKVDPKVNQSFGVTKRNLVRKFENVKSAYVTSEVEKILGLWRDAMVVRSTVRVSVIGSSYENLQWTKLTNSLHSYRQKSAKQYVSALKSAANELSSNTQVSIKYGVVSDIKTTDKGVHITVDTTMTESVYQVYLAKIAILIFGLLAACITVLMMRRRGGKKRRGNTVD